MKSPEDSLVLNDLRVVLSIAGSRHELFKLIQIIKPPGDLCISTLFYLVGKKDLVQGVVLVVKIGGGSKDALVAIAVEIIPGQEAEYTLGGFTINEQSAYHAFLCIDTMRQFPLAHFHHL